MRPSFLSALLVAACASVAPATWAAPLLTMQYQIDTLSRTVQFMGDGSVKICDGSVLVACDGSVLPVPSVVFRTLGDGSVQELTPFWLLGDGSVRTGTDLPVAADSIYLSALTFSPNPYLAATVTFVDYDAPSNMLINFTGPLILGANAFEFELDGSTSLTDAEGNGVSAGKTTQFGLDGIVFGGVDFVGLASLASGGLTGVGDKDLGLATGVGGCVACATQSLTIGLFGSGGGDQFLIEARLDLEEINMVPEPGTLALLCLAFTGLYAALKRKQLCATPLA